MRPLVVRPSRMPTSPNVKVTNVGDGDSPVISDEDFLAEETAAIPLSVYRSWGGHGKFDRTRYEALFRKYTGKPNSYRIYLPVKADAKITKPIVRVPENISEELKAQGYAVDDYIAGIAVDLDKGKRKIKIGKLLSKKAELKKLFDADPQRTASKKSKSDLLVVISRHPYDLAGASYSRGWRSCLHLTDGENREYVLNDVKFGTLIAYLVNNDDRNINKPIARLRIYSFVSEGENKEYFLQAESRVYGKAPSSFKDTVDKWISQVNTENLGKSNADGLQVFCVDQKVYDDTLPSRTLHIVTSVSNVPERLTEGSFRRMTVTPFYDIKEAITSGNFNAQALATKSSKLQPEDMKKLIEIFENPANSKLVFQAQLGSSALSSIASHSNANREIVLYFLHDIELLQRVSNCGVRKLSSNHELTAKDISSIVGHMEENERVPEARIALRYLLSNPNCPRDLWMKEILTDQFELSSDLLVALHLTVQDITEIIDYFSSKSISIPTEILEQPALTEELLKKACQESENIFTKLALQEYGLGEYQNAKKFDIAFQESLKKPVLLFPARQFIDSNIQLSKAYADQFVAKMADFLKKKPKGNEYDVSSYFNEGLQHVRLSEIASLLESAGVELDSKLYDLFSALDRETAIQSPSWTNYFPASIAINKLKKYPIGKSRKNTMRAIMRLNKLIERMDTDNDDFIANNLDDVVLAFSKSKYMDGMWAKLLPLLGSVKPDTWSKIFSPSSLDSDLEKLFRMKNRPIALVDQVIADRIADPEDSHTQLILTSAFRAPVGAGRRAKKEELPSHDSYKLVLVDHRSSLENESVFYHAMASCPYPDLVGPIFDEYMKLGGAKKLGTMQKNSLGYALTNPVFPDAYIQRLNKMEYKTKLNYLISADISDLEDEAELRKQNADPNKI